MLYTISDAIELLSKGGLLCIPTDTLFALSCDATNEASIERLYQIKMRDKEKKMPVLFHNIDHVMEYCHINDKELELLKRFWPGKLTMILNLKSHRLSILGNNIAARVPNCTQILEIIHRLNRPIIGTSANISGCNNINTLQEAINLFSSSEVKIFQNNRQISGIQSTIISLINDKINIIREGAIPVEEILSKS